jgi:hypothetical protein
MTKTKISLPKLKQATLVTYDPTEAVVMLLIQKKDKTIEEYKLVVEKKPKVVVDELFDDYWNSVEVDGKVFDINLWHKEKGELRATIYPTKQNGEHTETVTDKFNGCRLRSIPLSE